MKSKNVALILAAGEGVRMKSSINKHLLPIMGKPLLQYTLQVFQDHPSIDSIVLVGSLERFNPFLNMVKFDKLIGVVPGGVTRQESCWAGIQSIQNADLLIVHDGARPLVDATTIERVICAATKCGAAIAAVRTKDTLKEVGSTGVIIQTPNRDVLWQAQTPQVFKFDLLRQAHIVAIQDSFQGTDEASLVEHLGYPVTISEGDYRNLKVTTPEDFVIAEYLISERMGQNLNKQLVNIRLGLGHDSHRFVNQENPKPLVLGGIEIARCRGLDANSDGDVILHAIFNALSQAIGEHSLGYYADPLYKEKGVTDSRVYLKIAEEMVIGQGYEISNIGITIECQVPRIEAVSEQMRKSIAHLLDINLNQIGITATSGDGLTSFGKGEGIQAWAIVNLQLRKHG
jgi:2-C-methyl-D-erythritol 4-phosphate cytidylyltransferase/2-C-methyl-D-erythritol 2,4-cyclodiphosphate synthase